MDLGTQNRSNQSTVHNFAMWTRCSETLGMTDVSMCGPREASTSRHVESECNSAIESGRVCRRDQKITARIAHTHTRIILQNDG